MLILAFQFCVPKYRTSNFSFIWGRSSRRSLDDPSWDTELKAEAITWLENYDSVPNQLPALNGVYMQKKREYWGKRILYLISVFSENGFLCVEESIPRHQYPYQAHSWINRKEHSKSFLYFKNYFMLCNSNFYILFPVKSFCLLAYFWDWQRHKSLNEAFNLVQWLLRRKKNEWLLLVWSWYLEHTFIFLAFLNFYIPRELACSGSKEWLLVLFSTLCPTDLI